MSTSESSYTMILSAFTLDVKDNYTKRVRHMDALRMSSGHPRNFFEPGISEFDLYPNVTFAKRFTEKYIVREICGHYRITKSKFNRHFYYNAYIFAFTETELQVYLTSNKNGDIRTTLIDNVMFDEFKYMYIGFGNHICIWNISEDFIKRKLNGFPYTIYKISTKHLGGPNYGFDYHIIDWGRNCPQSIENPDVMYYYSINDKLHDLLRANPDAFYDHCMRLIVYERRKYDSAGNLISGYWSNVAANKSYEDFHNSQHVSEMLQMKYPIYWEKID